MARPREFERALALCVAETAVSGQHRFAALLRDSGRFVGVGAVVDLVSAEGFEMVRYVRRVVS